jgi:Fe-S cluster assembly iron-binding protein IscA
MSADMLKADPAGNEVQNIDELDIGEISEKYDIYDRYTEIARNKGQIFSITKKAEIYLAELITQENNKDSALKVEVVNAGTKDATVKLDFCIKSDLTKDYKEFPYEGFSAFIDKSYLKPINYLEDAHLSMKINGTNEKLAITANNIKREDPKIEALKSQEWLESGDI